MRIIFVSSSLRVLLVTIATVCVFSAANAHHSIAGQFDMTKTIHLSGVVTKLDWTNPHVYIQFEAKEKNGATSSWKLETLPVAMLRKAGITKQSLVTSETVEMDIVPARDGSLHWGFILNIKFPDGRSFQFSRDPNGTVVTTK